MKKNKNIIIFVTVLFSLSIVSGIVYGLNSDYNIINLIEELPRLNYYSLIDLAIVGIFLISGLSLTGPITNSIIISLEGIGIGYTLSSYIKNSSLLKGLISITYLKLFNIIILLYLFIVNFNYFKRCIKNLFQLEDDKYIKITKPLLKKYVLIIIIQLCINILNILLDKLILNNIIS